MRKLPHWFIIHRKRDKVLSKMHVKIKKNTGEGTSKNRVAINKNKPPKTRKINMTRLKNKVRKRSSWITTINHAHYIRTGLFFTEGNVQKSIKRL